MSTATATKPPLAPEDSETEAKEPKPPRNKKKMLIVVGAVLAVVLGAAWFLFLKPAGPTGPQPGAILGLDATQINLADGHYLKIGLALQLTTDATEVDGSKALDATIDLFTGLSMSEISRPDTRHALKKKLVTELSERYEGEVMGVYFTEYVTQ